MEFAFRKHWGAEFIDGRDVHFRVWAPGVTRVQLVCGSKGGDIAMRPDGDGWFDAVTDRLAPGDPYAFRLPDGVVVPDPAARAQSGDVHGVSRLVDPRAYTWDTADWRGRPWQEAVIYELHTGTFSEPGTFAGIVERLDHLVDTGVTAIELMPVAQFGGNRGWGYDGVLLYAPHVAYGGPEGLKALINAAHRRRLMVLLDVVYNHFGPDGNYLHRYAPDFFNNARETPWGAAIAYDRTAVRDFFVDNALFWLEEYRFDGLRFDAINEIYDPSPEHILETIAKAVRAGITDRHIHLTTEDDRNITRLHERASDGKVRMYTAEWNDDFHHAAHVVATGECEGYYVDYTDDPVTRLARTLAEGFAFQGEVSRCWGDAPRGVPSGHLPPTAFVNFLQNHDQIGNRAFNERLTDLAPAPLVETLTAILLLGPHVPLVFMGEEWGEISPFGFFTDFQGELAAAVREGRRREFRRFAGFADDANRERIFDPNAVVAFETSRINWGRLQTSDGRRRHSLVRRLLEIRQREIVSRLGGVGGHAAIANVSAGRTLGVGWRLADGGMLRLIANLGGEAAPAPLIPRGRVLYESDPGIAAGAETSSMPPWSVTICLDDIAASDDQAA